MSTSSPPKTSTAGTTPMTRLPEVSPNRAGIHTSSIQGLARNPSLRSSRPIRKGPARSSIGPDGILDEDAKAANTQLIADLKEQVERAEAASEQYRRQLDSMQKRLDEVSNETTAAEEREFQFRTQIDKLQVEVRESARQNRELESTFESEKKLLLKDRDARSNKEAEMQSIMTRLKESLKLKNQELAMTGKRDSSERLRTTKEDEESSSNDGGGNGQDYFHILEQKDTTIESLRLELADLHLKMAEQEHMGDGRSQALEKEMLDIKMRNARLQEENESFQMLLSEKTLKGDFLHDQPNVDTDPLSTLAEELESAEKSSEIPLEAYRKLEFENKTIRDSNKALTLYIDKIIGRLLKHEGFERIITDKEDDEVLSQLPAIPTQSEKALPELPPVEQSSPPSQDNSRPGTAAGTIANATYAAAGFLQRARSVVSRPAAPRSRPVSYAPAGPTANENPTTAPSIPLNRTHRRARSDQANDTGATNLAQPLNRGSPLRTPSGGILSPGMMSPLSSSAGNRLSFAGLGTAGGPINRVSSGTPSSNRPASSSNSIVSDQSQEPERESIDASSARASVYSTGGNNIPGAVMKQNQLRPLRLVQEQVQSEEDMQKKANRGSWMGWFNKAAPEPTNP